MRIPLRARWAAVAVAAVAFGPGQPASAGGQTAYAEITITLDAQQRVVVTEPGAGSTPSSWTCTTDHRPLGFHVTVSCVPAVEGTWACQSTYVLATYVGLPSDTLEAAAACGSRTVRCNPQQMPQVTGYCEEHGPGGTLPALSCEVDYSGAPAAAEWTALCRSYR
jgi:hypothetical protein